MITAEQLDQAEQLAKRMLQGLNQRNLLVVQLARCILMLVKEVRQARQELFKLTYRDDMGGGGS